MTYSWHWGGGHSWDFGFLIKKLVFLFNKIKAYIEEKCRPHDPGPDPDGNDNDCAIIDPGTAGGALVEGTAGDDAIELGDEGFTVEAGAGDDNVRGGAGNDRIIGGEGNENAIAGRDGDDYIEGNAGDDFLLGNRGNDILLGGTGNDNLSGGQGDDELCGGAGDDVVTGSRGNDILFGAGGADTFLFRVGDGEDVIRDFTTDGAERDRIDVTAFGAAFDAFAAIEGALAQDGDDAVLTLADDQIVRIDNVQIGDLTADNFVLG